jgi:hypothetical protein
MGLGHSPSIVVDGLVFYIDPNNTNCYSGSGNTIYNLVNPSIGGTFVGYTSNPIDNTENRSLVYNGSTTYQEFYPIEPTRFTVSVWFKATGAPSINDQYGGTILASSPQYYISYGMLYRWTTNTVLFIQSQNGEIISANAPANKYVNAVYTYDGANTKLYIDGVLASTVPYTTDPQYFGSGNRNLRLGVWGYPGYERYFNGNIGQTLIYNRVLSATEILQNYNAKKKKYDPDENIVTNGLVLHIDPSKNTSYPGTGNTIYDLSGSGNTGTLTNGPVLSSSNGGVIVLDGANDYISFNNAYASGFGISANATISIWAKITDENYYQPLVGFYNPAAGNRSDFGIDITQSDTDRIWKNDSAAQNNYLIKFGRWDNYVLTSDTSTAKMYVNGDLKSTLSSSGGINNNRMFVIGYNWDGMSNASISQTLLYNKTLTAQEILQNYNATKNRFVNALSPVRNGLVLELDAGQRASYPGTGNTWYDLSGNSLNGTLANAPTFSGVGASSSILFNASNQVVTLPLNSKLDISESITIESFIYPTAYNTANEFGSFIICKAASYYLELNGNGKVRVYFYSLSSEGYHESVGTVPLNTWSYISVVRNKASSTISMYINGILDRTLSSITGDIRVQQTYVVSLGSFFGSGYTFTGRIAVGTIYNRALSAYEVKQNFDFYRTRYNI